jgi:transposase
MWQGGLQMRDCTQGRFRQQLRFLRRQFLQEGELPFSDVLSEKIVKQALTEADVVWNERIYTPLVTHWIFLNQVLSADHSCRAAVARLISHRMSRGLRPCSPETGAYCQARKRLPEKFFAMVCRMVGQALDAKVDSKWLWNGRHVYMFDGTVVRMPDTIRAHRSAAGALNSPRKTKDNEALGRSQGGNGTKLHIMTDSQGILLAITATPGQSHEAKEFPNMMKHVELSIGRLNKRPKQLAGDKGYSSNKIRQWLIQKQIKPVIPTKNNEAKHPFNKRAYRKRNIVERTIGWLKDHRRIATRYDKNIEYFLAFAKIAVARKLLKLI